MSHHTISKNGLKCYLDLKGHLKTETYDDTKSSNANSTLQSAHYDGNRKFTLENYYNLVAKEFVQLEETGPVYILTESQNINSFENGLKEPTYINFSITKKGSVTSYRPDNRLLIATITPYQHLMGDFKA